MTPEQTQRIIALFDKIGWPEWSNPNDQFKLAWFKESNRWGASWDRQDDPAYDSASSQTRPH